MNSTILEGKWNVLKGTLRSRWGKLTDDDVDEVKGNSEILVGKLQQRYGHAKEQVQKDVNAWLSESEP